MKFTLVKGTFLPIAGIPDGDTVKFKPQCWSTLEGLESAGRRLKKSKRGCGTVALRYEGIDAPERGAKEPFASAATAKNIELLGLRDVYDEGPGYILVRQLGPWGRPIAFVFAGEEAPAEDGASICLDVELMKQSVNFQLIRAGAVYPLFYETLDENLREAIASEVREARRAERGLWPRDNTTDGVSWGSKWSLPKISPIFPKLWRRLKTYLRENDCRPEEITLATFEDFLREQGDQLYIAPNLQDRVLLSDIVDINVGEERTTVRMRYSPEELIFIS